MNRRLKKGWFWSYIFSPMGVKKKWSACAVKPTGEYDRLSHYPIYQEVFEVGISEESVISKVRKSIKEEKWEIRAINLCND